MAKNPETPNIENGKNKSSFLDILKKFWRWMKDVISMALHPDSYMLCWDHSPYFWLQVWDKWELRDVKSWKQIKIQKDGEELAVEANEVKDIEQIWLLSPLSIWRIFRCGSEWWLVAENWTIVLWNYSEIGLYAKVEGDHEYDIAVWKEILPNWDEKLRDISLEDWSISEHVPFNSEDDE